MHLMACMFAKTMSARPPSRRVRYPRYRFSCLLTIPVKNELHLRTNAALEALSASRYCIFPSDLYSLRVVITLQ